MYDKHMCYCENAGGTLAESIVDAEGNSPQLISAVEETSGKLTQLKDILKRMSDELSKDLGDTTAAEKAAIAPYGELMTTKTNEVNALN